MTNKTKIRITQGRAAAMGVSVLASKSDDAVKLIKGGKTAGKAFELELDKAQAATIAKAAISGIDDADLRPQQRGALRAAVAVLVSSFMLTRKECGLEPTPSKLPAAKAAAKRELQAKKPKHEPQSPAAT